MRAKISLSASLAVVALGFVVTSAQAHGVGVSVKDSYLPGTIPHPHRRAPALLFHRLRGGDPLSGRRWARGHAMGGHRLHRR